MKKMMSLFVLASCVSMLNAGAYLEACGGSSYQGQPQHNNQPSASQGYKGSMNPNNNSGSQSMPNMPRKDDEMTIMGDGLMNPEMEQKMATRIKEALKNFSGKYKDITVIVKGGRVTLEGTVPTQADKEALDQRVKSISGMMEIDNRVTVQSPAANDMSY